MAKAKVRAPGAVRPTNGFGARPTYDAINTAGGDYAMRTHVRRLRLRDRGWLMPASQRTITLEEYRVAHALASLAGG